MYRKFISKFNKKTVLVIGDLILDRYIRGSVSRISPEAPVPILLEEESFYTPGGAANVAHNLSCLGANVVQVGRIGNDFEGHILKRELKRKKVNVAGVFIDKKLPTVTKTRVIAQHQQIVRIDKERIQSKGDKVVNEKIIHYIAKMLDQIDAVIISDYGKGLISPELVSSICSKAIQKKKVVTVDPKVEHFSYYCNVTAITPNKKEVENAIRNIKITEKRGNKLGIDKDQLNTPGEIDLAGQQLLKFLDLDCLLMTLGEQGMRLFEKGKKSVRIKTKAQEVYDVTGAGDTVISVFTLGLCSGASKRQAANLSNMAAGIVVGKLGAVAITKEDLLDAIKDK